MQLFKMIIMNRITFVPVGGLANRMRAIASVITLAQQTDSKLKVIWFPTWDLYAPFDFLFEPINKDCITLRNASTWDKFTIDRPRRKNLCLPYLFQYLTFGDCKYECSFYSLIQQKFDFKGWVMSKREVYMASYYAFYPYELSLIGEIFSPIQSIKERIDDRCTQFVNNTIGVHIRRTDNIASIQQSPLELFFEKVDEELDKDNHTVIYLATDSEEVKLQMRKRYGNRIISSSTPADRNSVAGIQDGLIDMYTLARTRKIYGSFQSSFSEMASQIGGIPLEILKK